MRRLLDYVFAHPVFVCTTVVPILAIALWFYFAVVYGLPTPAEVADRHPPASSILLDRNGKPLYRIFAEEDRTPVSLSSLPQHFIDATLAIEDAHFFQHSGFSLAGMARALRNNFTHSNTLQGGSTITQQLVKNRVLGPQKTITRKLKELVLAVQLERELSKEQILEMYLNQVAFGGAAYGVEAAALSHFGKPSAELTLSESAFLAGMLRAPSAYSPFIAGGTAYLYRKRIVLRRMLDEGFITADQHHRALHEWLRFSSQRNVIKAPHFALYVKKLMLERYGEEKLSTGGLRVRTTLDLELQNEVQSGVSAFVARMFRYRVSNGAALVTNPRTGEILSMVGSADYFDTENEGQVNVTLRKRQPGSTIKPMTYAMSLQGGKTAATMLSDKPIELEIPNEGSYKPRNLDFEFRGNVTLRQALAASRNIPAVNELVAIGVRNYIRKAKTLGIDGWDDQNDYRYALTLGSGEVRMVDMAQMFSTFPNGGFPVAPDPILSVAENDGSIIYSRDCAFTEQGCPGRQAFEPGVAFLINDILSDNIPRSLTFGEHSDLVIEGHQVAAKTGTTDLLRDNWTIGYTTSRLVAVWIGNNNGSPMRFVASGERGASTIWNKIMRYVLKDTPPHRFAIPEDIMQQQVCVQPRVLACEPCSKTRMEFFLKGTAPDESCRNIVVQ